MAEWLAAQGHEVRVVTAPPYYPQWRVAEGFANWWDRDNGQGSRGKWQVASEVNPPQPPFEKKRGSLVVYRCPLWVPRKPSGLKRVLHLTSFALSSFPVMLRQIFWRPDVVWVVEPALFCAPQAWLVARLSGGKAWLHVQDFEVDAAFDLGILKSSSLRRVVLVLERWLMRRFDVVSTISDKMLERVVAKGVNEQRACLFPNWVDIEGLRTEDSGLSGFREELGISGEAVVALYSGNMGNKQGLEILAGVGGICKLRQASRDKSRPTTARFAPEVIFVFCGNGVGRADLVALCDGLPNVRFLELQPVERLGALLGMADIHLLPQRADAADLVMPSKLTGMLASGRPVVATAALGTQVAMVVEQCGLVVPPGDAGALADAVLCLADDADVRAELGAKARAYAEAHLDRDAVLGKFETDLKAVTEWPV